MRPQWQHGGGAAVRRKSEVLRAGGGGGGADVGGGGASLRASPSKTRGSRRESLDSEASFDSLSGEVPPHTVAAAAAASSAPPQRVRKASLDRGRVEVPPLPIPSTVMETSARRELGLGGSGSESSSPTRSPNKEPHATSGFNDNVDGGGDAPAASSDAADTPDNATAPAVSGGGGASPSPDTNRSRKHPRSSRPKPPAMVVGGNASSVSMNPAARAANLGPKLPKEGTRARDFVDSIDKLKRKAAAVLSSSHTAADLEAAQRASQAAVAAAEEAEVAALSAWGGSPEKPSFTLTARDSHHEESVPL